MNQNKPTDRQLMPDETVKRFMERFRAISKKPVSKDFLTLLRKEYKMTVQVYGNRVMREKKNSTKYKQLAKVMCQRLFVLEHLAKLIKNRINMGGQSTMFPDPKIEFNVEIDVFMPAHLVGQGHMEKFTENLSKVDFIKHNPSHVLDVHYSSEGSAQFLVQKIEMENDTLCNVYLEFIGTAS